MMTYNAANRRATLAAGRDSLAAYYNGMRELAKTVRNLPVHPAVHPQWMSTLVTLLERSRRRGRDNCLGNKMPRVSQLLTDNFADNSFGIIHIPVTLRPRY